MIMIITNTIKHNNSVTQRDLMMSKFIQTTEHLIEHEGLDHVKIRDIAKLMHCNSATIYIYFKDLDQLLCYASMKYLREYSIECAESTQKCETIESIIYTTWKLFSHHAFSRPEIYAKIFFNRHRNDLEDIMADYYRIFPTKVFVCSDLISRMLFCADIFQRNLGLMQIYAQKHGLNRDTTQLINKAMIYSFESILLHKTNGLDDRDVYSLTEEMMQIIHYLLDSKITTGGNTCS